MCVRKRERKREIENAKLTKIGKDISRLGAEKQEQINCSNSLREVSFTHMQYDKHYLEENTKIAQ
jgi:hypothetical protein